MNHEDADHRDDVEKPGLIGRVLHGVVQLVLVGAVGFGTFWGVTKLFEDTAPATDFKKREKQYTVQTQILDPADARQTINLFGTVVAGKSVELRSLVAGTIIDVNPDLKPGGSVRKGDVLAEIDPFTYEGALTEARANLTEAEARLGEARSRVELETTIMAHAEAQLDLALKDEKRAVALAKRGTLTAQTLDNRKLVTSQRKQALEQRQRNQEIERTRVTQQQAAVERLKWQVRRAEHDLENTRLKAPFDGIVLSETVEAGRLVSVNDVVTSLYDTASLEVRFTLSDAQYGLLVEDDLPITGREVEVNWRLGNSERLHRAVIDRVGAEVAADRGGVDIFARLKPDGDGDVMRPGAFVELTIPGYQVEQGVRVPESAIYGGNRIFLIIGDRLKGMQIELVGYEDGQAIITGNFNRGDEIVTSRLSRAGDGLLVKRKGDKKPALVDADKIAVVNPESKSGE